MGVENEWITSSQAYRNALQENMSASQSTLLIPFYVAVTSAAVLSIQLIVDAYNSRVNLSVRSAADEDVNARHGSNTSIAYGVKRQMTSMGGCTIFWFKAAKLLGCLSLVGFTVATLVYCKERHSEIKTDESLFVQMTTQFGYKEIHHLTGGSGLSTTQWCQIAVLTTYVYASVLALTAAGAPPRQRLHADRHLATVLLITFGVFAYRNVWPLMTFTERPLDCTGGWLLWIKLAILGIVAIVIPLLTPRVYVPLDPKNPAVEPNPEQVASLLSLMLYTYLDPFIFKASRDPKMLRDELPPLADYDYTANLVKRSFKYLDTSSGARKGHLFFSLMRIFRREYVILSTMLVIRVFVSFASPIGINQLLQYFEKQGEGVYVRPWVWILWLFLCPFIVSGVMQWYTYIAGAVSVRIKGIITQLVFDHALRIRMKAVPSDAQANSERKTSGSRSTNSSTNIAEDSAAVRGVDHVGKLNNLVTSDLNNIRDGRDFLLLFLMAPLVIVLAVCFLYVILGWSALIGMIVMVLGVPVTGYIANIIQNVQVERMKKTDSRVQLVSEVMGVLRMIKMFGWEAKINAQLAEKREEELKYIFKHQMLRICNGLISYLIPLSTMIATYSVYTIIMKKQLTASTVFSSMAVFDMVKDQLHSIYHMVPLCVQAKVSLDRVAEFLHESELLDEYEGGQNSLKSSAAAFSQRLAMGDFIGFRDASFVWSKRSGASSTPSQLSFRLRIDGELQFKPGSFNLIVGPTGSGKTSLLMALLGEMHFVPTRRESYFNLPRAGGVAYAAQEAWVQNETIRDNILFGSPYEENRYKQVIYECCLERDLELFEAGDNTEVGEKGLTLSGGQKARITLARAIYSRAKIILLDDVLAALDVHTARWVVNKCLQGDIIRGRTVLLVTHNVAIIEQHADFVVTVTSDGRVAGQETSMNAIFKEIVGGKVDGKNDTTSVVLEEVVHTKAATSNRETSSGKLIVAEEVAEGRISWKAVKLYLYSLGGPWLWLVFIGGLLICDLAITMQTWWLGHWASQYDIKPPGEVNAPRYLTIYWILLLVILIPYSTAYTFFQIGTIRASRAIHKRLVESVTGATLRWLDTTPTARVITRCTQDIRAVDGPVSEMLGWQTEMTVTMMVKFGAVILFTPIFVLPGIAVGVLGGWCGTVYVNAQLPVKREMSNARSPILSHFAAAMAGIVSIRAYGCQVPFKLESMKRIDRYTRAARTFQNLNQWVGIRIETLGGLFAAALAAWFTYHQDLSKPNNIGFSLNMAVGFTSLLLWWVRANNEFEISGETILVHNLERIQDYLSIEQEQKATSAGVPPAHWPSSSEIRVENLSARYSVDGPKVLENVSFKIKPGERVGVVGRTGSGKSTLTLSLLRCIHTEGSIYYDSIPTSSVNLDILRRNITIIPQVPELLSGTLRRNLDPFDEHDDATLNDALRSAGLFALQRDNDDVRITLDSIISNAGGNLSVGQRQILALARAIVRRSKLLILDEATSAIDYETDTIIQASLRNELPNDVSLITIAHRLQTIMDADKIMVLDAGRIVEYDTPSVLLRKDGGLLKSLVDESGDREKLYAIAGGKAERTSS
ncbi:hypothetical protein BD410DRAFT_820769 [Rickenella mellea]|uniref:P-loop containing nucleoside triphosphate hydrolase protein n=1 Tax=Rickenella mellea TaxID=50990 RepID=A0A4Y7Q7H0_9AGAM|nr:hypothetical protein BD410DRAFT_820769 [Rickenella mellea]